MDKDAYYFPHFCNARHDRKIRRVRKELGPEGYGIFFMLLEVLRDQSDFRYPIEDMDLLADEFGTSEQKVRTVVTNYQLFDVDEKEQFFSPKLQVYLQPYLEKSQRAKLAAEKRWANHRKQIEECKSNANALPEHSKSNADQNAIITEETIKDDNKINKSKEVKRKNGEYSHVLLTDKEYKKLIDDFGDVDLLSMITNLDEYIEMKGVKYKNHNLTMRKWKSKEVNTSIPFKKESDNFNVYKMEKCKSCGKDLKQGICPDCDLSGASETIKGIKKPWEN